MTTALALMVASFSYTAVSGANIVGTGEMTICSTDGDSPTPVARGKTHLLR